MDFGSLSKWLTQVLTVVVLSLACQPVIAQLDTDNITQTLRPWYDRGEPIYADIDTASQQLYVVLSDGIWRYGLESEHWELLTQVNAYPEPLNQLDFGYDPFKDRLLFWSRGIGTVYEFDLQTLEIERVDKSFPHNNQYGHYPFFRDGELYAFGGYGFWRFKNLITFFNSRIREWNIQTVAENSTFPDPQVPFTGAYLDEEDELFIYGGELLENSRFDDKNGVKILKEDIWKFNFSTRIWEKQAALEEDNWDFATTSRVSSLSPGTVNTRTKSFYSKNSGYWYLPVHSESSLAGLYYVKPYHLETRKEYDPLELPLGDSKEFIVSNFLFNPKSQDIVLVGLDYLTNAETMPMCVVLIPEDSLLTAIEERTEGNTTFVVASLFAALGILITVILVLKSGFGFQKTDRKNKIAVTELLGKEYFNDAEIKLIEALWEADSFLETSDLEEIVWSDVDNYDYRRKLRNETIKSINQKFETNTGVDEKLVVRKRDLQDNRRFHYGLNEEIIE